MLGSPVKREGAGSGTARPGLLTIGGVVAPEFPVGYPELPCAKNPELHQPDGYGQAFITQIERAKAVCRRCPALAECRDWAIANAEPEGIWGATTPLDRDVIRERAGLRKLRGHRTGFYDENGRRVR